jgi:hypothetical protein
MSDDTFADLQEARLALNTAKREHAKLGPADPTRHAAGTLITQAGIRFSDALRAHERAMAAQRPGPVIPKELRWLREQIADCEARGKHEAAAHYERAYEHALAWLRESRAGQFEESERASERVFEEMDLAERSEQ